MVTVKKFPNFHGPFHTLMISYNINREKGTNDRFVVFSSGKRHALVKYLWYKLVWDELSRMEFHLFISMPEVLNNTKILAFLRCRLEIDKRILRQRLLQIENLIGETPTIRSTYQGLKRMRIEIQRETISLQKVPKFSGYVRNISAIGRGNGGSRDLEPVTDFVYEEIRGKIDWYLLLSVGEFSLLGQEYKLPEENQ